MAADEEVSARAHTPTRGGTSPAHEFLDDAGRIFERARQILKSVQTGP